MYPAEINRVYQKHRELVPFQEITSLDHLKEKEKEPARYTETYYMHKKQINRAQIILQEKGYVAEGCINDEESYTYF